MLDSFSDYDKERLTEWANSDDGECWLNENMDGFSVLIGEKEYSINKGKEKAGWDDFFERLIKAEFIAVERYNSDGSPIYKLKKAAYDYVNSLR